ncbi:HAD family hydrolase [Paenibacillus harenae]|uniref:HAD superfamily hydrolase (TIGR01509 family) n=1 Tax=Paenibacillus harenae TaxID=306543 RepID=A0ABT9TYV3_PAEHA|nr:HAD family phosphatase [Paenibacillus harenae]MDQ0112561.1 HAD superfamily hydrolase (TIGR01509 family) [Paenibacillus harenae]
MQKIGKALIFDLDGVIVNSQDLYENTLSIFLRDLGVNNIDFKSLIGMTTAGALSHISTTHILPGTIADLTKEFQRIYQKSFKLSLSEDNLIEGVKHFIIRVANTNVRLAVASSASRPKIEMVLTRFGLSRYFDSIVSGYEVKESKPAPDVFIQSALNLNIEPSDCIVIEDSTNGIIGAKTAGMLCVGFRNPKSGNQDLTGADCVLESFLETEIISLHNGFLELNLNNRQSI